MFGKFEGCGKPMTYGVMAQLRDFSRALRMSINMMCHGQTMVCWCSHLKIWKNWTFSKRSKSDQISGNIMKYLDILLFWHHKRPWKQLDFFELWASPITAALCCAAVVQAPAIHLKRRCQSSWPVAWSAGCRCSHGACGVMEDDMEEVDDRLAQHGNNDMFDCFTWLNSKKCVLNKPYNEIWVCSWLL